MASTKRRRGRPPAGVGGTKRTDMRQIAARVTQETYQQLKALTVVINTSQVDVLTQALNALEQTLPPDERRLVRMIVRGKK